MSEVFTVMGHFGVSNYERAKGFYATDLAPFGIAPVMEVAASRPKTANSPAPRPRRPDRAPTSTWPSSRKAAPKWKLSTEPSWQPRQESWAPGLRPHDHPNYYGAFVIAPGGMPHARSGGIAPPASKSRLFAPLRVSICACSNKMALER